MTKCGFLEALTAMGSVLGGMHELQMSSLTWSQIQAAQFHPRGRTQCTLTAVEDDKLVLHGGLTKDQTHGLKKLSDTWIMDLRSHSWRQFTSRKYHPRWQHTGSTGLNNSVIIIGGGNNSHPDSDNVIVNVMLEPKSLQKVAMQAIFKYRNDLPLNRLPRKVQSRFDHVNN